MKSYSLLHHHIFLENPYGMGRNSKHRDFSMSTFTRENLRRRISYPPHQTKPDFIQLTQITHLHLLSKNLNRRHHNQKVITTYAPKLRDAALTRSIARSLSQETALRGNCIQKIGKDGGKGEMCDGTMGVVLMLWLRWRWVSAGFPWRWDLR